MTNKDKLQQIENRLDNPEELGLLEHFDLIFNQLPFAISGAKFRPDAQWSKSKDESEFEKNILDVTDVEFNK